MGSGARRFRTILAVAACTLAMTACSKPNGTPGPSGAGQPTPSATGGGLAGGGPAGPSGGTGGGTTVSFPTDAGAYTKAAVAAWVAKNVSALDQYEDTGGQLHTMLACAGCYNTAFALNHCDGAAGSTYCLFFNAVGDELRLRVNNTLLGQPRAMGAGSIFNPIAFPTDDKAYAQEALDAWQARDDARLKLLTAANVTSAQVDAKGADHTGNWSYDHSEGAAGSSYLSWKQDGTPHSLPFRFTNGPAAPPPAPASQPRITDIVYMP